GRRAALFPGHGDHVRGRPPVRAKSAAPRPRDRVRQRLHDGPRGAGPGLAGRGRGRGPPGPRRSPDPVREPPCRDPGRAARRRSAPRDGARLARFTAGRRRGGLMRKDVTRAVRGPRRLLRRLGVGVAVLLGLLVLALAGLGLWVRGRLLAGLPPVRGQRAVAGVDGPVVIARDRLGIPVVRGGSRRDVAFATGFLHAGERFFQMDLQRRRAAGELAEILGPGLLKVDRPVRSHAFRTRAERILTQLPDEQRTLLAAYAKGVNAGLA